MKKYGKIGKKNHVHHLEKTITIIIILILKKIKI
jgi:hypothetical protein